MRCAARVHDELGVRQMTHQQAGATGVVEMHMGWHHIIHVGLAQSDPPQGLQHPRHAMGSAGVDECRAALLQHQVAGGEPFAVVAGIDAGDAMSEIAEHCAHVGLLQRSSCDTSRTAPRAAEVVIAA